MTLSMHTSRRRRTGPRYLAALGVMSALLAACVPPAPIPTMSCIANAPATAADYQQLFDVRATEAAAADIWTPTADGARTVWFLGDTFAGRQQPPGVLAPSYRFLHNAVQVQSGACLESLMGGVAGTRTDWFAQPTASEYYWPAGTYRDGDGLKAVLLLVRPFDREGEGFDFYVAGIRVAALDANLAATSITRPTPLVDTTSPAQPNIPYGNAVAQDDQYVYLYGSARTSEYIVSNYVARAATANVVSGPWEYWDGTGWSSDATAAVGMTFDSAPMSQLRVTRYGDGWIGVAKMIDGFTEDVTAWYSLSPTGPWVRVPTANGDGKIATTPKADDDDLVYGASLVNLPGAGWTVMWNINAFPVSEVTADVRRYGPRFAAPSDLETPEELFP